MKEKVKQILKKRPWAFKMAKGVYSFFSFILLKPMERIKFWQAMVFGKQYFGPILNAQQGGEERYAIMRKLAETELEKSASSDYKILELGSWAGGSAFVWASVCHKHGKGKVYCVDHWQAAENSPDFMKRAVRHDKILKLFLHNIEAAGFKDIVTVFKGHSDAVVGVLKPESFDLGYIDGDHSYDQFKKDLANYSELVKVGGCCVEMIWSYSQMKSI